MAPKGIPKWLRPGPLKLAVGLSLVMALFHYMAFLDGRPARTTIGLLEAKALDLKLLARGPLPPSGRVTVIAIDEAALGTYGRWPWDRGTVAELVTGLTEAGARVIALDMSFVDPQTAGRHVALQEAQRVYFAALARVDPVEDGVKVAQAGDPRRLESLEKFFRDEIKDRNPDDQLAKAIFESGRVVWSIIAHTSLQGTRSLGAEHFQAAFERIEPFLGKTYTRIYVDDDGHEREIDDDVPLEATDMPFIDVGLETPLPQFAAATPFFGFMNTLADPDGVLRRFEPVRRYRGRLVPALAVRAVAAYLNSEVHLVRDRTKSDRPGLLRFRVGSAPSELWITDAHGALRWTDRRAQILPTAEWEQPWSEKWAEWLDARNDEIDEMWDPDDEDFDEDSLPEVDPASIPGYAEGDVVDVPLDANQHGRLLINHLGRATAFDTIGAADVLAGIADPALLEGRIALVGVTAMGTFDQRVTAFDEFIPGVYVQAALMDTMLSGRFIVREALMVPLEMLTLILMGLAIGLVLPRLKGGIPLVGFLVAGLGGYIALDLMLFIKGGIDFFLVTPVVSFVFMSLAVVAFQLVVTDKEKRYVRRAFQHYLAPSVLEAVLQDPTKLALNPAKAELSILFSDIRGFTTISERLTPEKLAVVLNEYLSPMTDIVFANGGTLDKYMGDAIMAFWGDPVPYEDHALRACRTALQMLERLEELSVEFEERGWPVIEIGCGVNTGQVSVGNFGSKTLFDYTVMGDSVNLGSRLEGINKEYGTHAIISEFTLAQVEGQVVVRELDAVRVKGKREPVRIFELRSMGQASEHEQEFLDEFADAVAVYKQRLWDDAIGRFLQCVEMRPDDFASKMYIARCHSMKEQPPPDDWDGVYTMTTK